MERQFDSSHIMTSGEEGSSRRSEMATLGTSKTPFLVAAGGRTEFLALLVSIGGFSAGLAGGDDELQ
ncbi:MAG: hypothetical protein QGH33_17045, partial [Pirellulaceae bacterium]|nr:hypothetical protein [Pirellulaceae bacterium]